MTIPNTAPGERPCHMQKTNSRWRTTRRAGAPSRWSKRKEILSGALVWNSRPCGGVNGWMLIWPNAARLQRVIQDHKLKCKCSKDNVSETLDRMMGCISGHFLWGSGSFALFCPIRSHEMYRNYIMWLYGILWLKSETFAFSLRKSNDIRYHHFGGSSSDRPMFPGSFELLLVDIGAIESIVGYIKAVGSRTPENLGLQAIAAIAGGHVVVHWRVGWSAHPDQGPHAPWTHGWTGPSEGHGIHVWNCHRMRCCWFWKRNQESIWWISWLIGLHGLVCPVSLLRKWLRRQEAKPATSAEWEASRKQRWSLVCNEETPEIPFYLKRRIKGHPQNSTQGCGRVLSMCHQKILDLESLDTSK